MRILRIATATAFAVSALLVMTSLASAEALTWGKPVKIADQPLESLSCPTTTFCAAGSGVDIYTSTDPSATRPTPWAVHQVERVTTYTPDDIYTASLSCVGRELCVGVPYGDLSDPLALSTTPSAKGSSSWSQHYREIDKLANKDIFSLSCPIATLCFGGSFGSGAVQTILPQAPAGPWPTAFLPTQNFDCNYGPEDFPTCPSGIGSIDCPTVALCVGVDSSGQVLSSTDPTGPASAWQLSELTPQYAPPFAGQTYSEESCPTVTFCAIVWDPTGQVFTSTDPTGGPTAWQATSINDSSIQAISCASTALCVAVDSKGYAIASTDPTATEPVWTRTRIDRSMQMTAPWFTPIDFGLTGIDCISTRRCIAVDGYGDEVIGTATA